MPQQKIVKDDFLPRTKNRTRSVTNNDESWLEEHKNNYNDIVAQAAEEGDDQFFWGRKKVANV